MILFLLDKILNWFLEYGIRIVLIIIGIFIFQIILKTVIKKVIKSIIKFGPLRNGLGREKRIDTLNRIFIRTANIVLWITGLLMILSELKINIAPILTGAGVLGLAVGFGSRDLVTNLINGLFILIEDQYAEGDEVKIAGLEGKVEKISLRTTILKDKNGIKHIIPNSSIKIVSNLSKK